MSKYSFCKPMLNIQMIDFHPFQNTNFLRIGLSRGLAFYFTRQLSHPDRKGWVLSFGWLFVCWSADNGKY